MAQERRGWLQGVIRRLRLASGLVMFAYVTTHFVNHSLGLISVEIMDHALERIYQYWASPLGGVILYGAFATHYGLALWALWLRRSLRMPVAEATQLVLGFSIPFFLTDHVLQTRVADRSTAPTTAILQQYCTHTSWPIRCAAASSSSFW
jgi:adenylate cyclase